jgi:transcriptional regulator with XRE-family HTH domain
MSRAPISVVPTWRLGALLRSEREQRGSTTTDLASGSTSLSPDDLAEIEAGTRQLDDHELAAVLDLYGVDSDALVPDRDELIVDLDQRELAAAGRTQALAGSAPSPDEVLGTYLTLVYALRSVDPGTPLRMRQGDVDVLARALALAVPDVEVRLEGLMAEPEMVVLHQRSKLLRARVLVPAAGVLVAVCVGGALVVSSRHAPATTAPSSTVADRTNPTTSNGSVTPSTTAHPAADGTPPVIVGNDITPSQVPAGGVGLAPAQVVTRGPGGQPEQSDRGASSSSTTTLTTP